MNEKKVAKGWRNDYRVGMPVAERLWKDIRSFISDTAARWHHAGRLPVLVCWPDWPSKKTTVMKIAHQQRMRITNHLVKQPACVLWFDDATKGDPSALVAMYPHHRILNVACTDISKQHVEEIHQQVLGYGMHCIPQVHHGMAVQKSDGNAVHDGRYVICPLEDVQPGDVYQRVIDNSISEFEVMDYRVPVIAGTPVLVYRKFKKMELRFTNEVVRSELAVLADVFTQEELKMISEFTRAMGADFCELDILRDHHDGRIYIIDLNKTPYGPPAKLPDTKAREAVERMSQAFAEAYLRQL
ncbi:MAG: hypothetical protein ACKO66_03130 [Flavobacteriales bacterium]